MTVDQLKSVVSKCEETGLRSAYLVMIKPMGWKLKGFKVRTPFGLCEVVNVQEREGNTEILFLASVDRIKRVIKELENYSKDEG